MGVFFYAQENTRYEFNGAAAERRACHLFSGYDANQVKLQQNGFVNTFNVTRAPISTGATRFISPGLPDHITSIRRIVRNSHS